MSFYNMPAGCLGPSDIDHYAALGHYDNLPFCDRCKQEECECCNECGASPTQACEPWCGFPECPSDELAQLWSSRSDLFDRSALPTGVGRED